MSGNPDGSLGSSRPKRRFRKAWAAFSDLHRPAAENHFPAANAFCDSLRNAVLLIWDTKL
jgi:hypothetical protein